MEINLLSIGKIGSKWINEALSLFTQRIDRYIKFNSIILPDIKNNKYLSKEEIKEEEGKLILNSLVTSDYVILLDEKGKEFTSREFAEWIQKQMNTGRKRTIFVIGGPYGFSESVYKRANTLIALSKMTFTHEMAKLVLIEQMYRAMTILRGEPYHHD